jgi:uncharacterized spore protein YtfJ
MDESGTGGVVDSILERIKDLIGAVTVYDSPVQRGDVTVIPASVVLAGGGGGGGNDAKAGSGEGGGVGIVARPVGAYVIRADDTVIWKPAISPGVILLAVLVATRAARRIVRALN